MIYIGIDVGQSGAIATIFDNGNIDLLDMPIITTKSSGKNNREYNIPAIAEYIESRGIKSIIGIESVHSMPKQGVSSCFSFGKGFGILLGIIGTLKIPYELIMPQKWKKEMLSGMGKDKGASIIKAKQLFPDADIHLKKHDGRAEALLIAQFMRQKHERN